MVDDNQHKLEVAYDQAISTDAKQQVIGIQKEKVLHKTLKYFLCECLKGKTRGVFEDVPSYNCLSDSLPEANL